MKNRKAALYVRVSTHHQIDKDSLPFQRKELINYCKYALNIDDYVIFEDAGFSGKDTARPAYQDMMKRIKAGEFTHLFVWKIDRISRNLRDFTEMYDELKDYGVTFVSKNEQFDTSSAMGEAMLKIILVFAELERKLTAERVKSIMLSRAEKGLWNGAAVPLGYDFDEEIEQPVINVEEAETVKFIYDTYEEVQSSLEVKCRLDKHNIRTKKNRNWTSKTVSDIIRNPFYMGTYRYNYRYSTGGKIRPEGEWIVRENNHPAIITKEQYERCNVIMDGNATRKGSLVSDKRNVHIFARLVNCTKCDRKYVASADRPRGEDKYRPSVYRCFNNVHTNKDNKKCIGMVGEVKLGPFVINYISNLIKAKDQVINDRTITKEQLEKLILKGSYFDYIAGIDSVSLDSIYDSMLRGAGHVLFEPSHVKSDSQTDYEASKILNEKVKLERALERLEDLYLFDDHSMTEKNYLIKRKSINDKLEEIVYTMEKETKLESMSLQQYDLDFIESATQYLISENINEKEEIDYNNIIRVVDKKLMKQLINTIIKQININDDKKVHSIEFTNGMKHVFVHRD